MEISALSFGRIRVDGVEYHRDLILTPGSIHCPWIRKQGHNLDLEDLDVVLRDPPERLFIGTGMAGRMRINPEVIAGLTAMGIDCRCARTARAVKEYCAAAAGGIRCAGAFHLTC